MSSPEKPAAKGRSRLDQVDKRLVSDILAILVILLFTIAAFSLIGGGLALTVFIAADVVLFRRG